MGRGGQPSDAFAGVVGSLRGAARPEDGLARPASDPLCKAALAAFAADIADGRYEQALALCQSQPGPSTFAQDNGYAQLLRRLAAAATDRAHVMWQPTFTAACKRFGVEGPPPAPDEVETEYARTELLRVVAGDWPMPADEAAVINAGLDARRTALVVWLGQQLAAGAGAKLWRRTLGPGNLSDTVRTQLRLLRDCGVEADSPAALMSAGDWTGLVCDPFLPEPAVEPDGSVSGLLGPGVSEDDLFTASGDVGAVLFRVWPHIYERTLAPHKDRLAAEGQAELRAALTE